MKHSFATGGILLSTLLAVAASGAEPAPGRAPMGPPGGFNMGSAGKIEKVADNLYVIPGGGGNTTVFVSSRGVVLVDSKVPNQGQAIMDQIRTVTDKPVIYLINTHSHFDHTGSNAFFPAAVEIVAHGNLAEQLKANPAFQSEQGRQGLVDRTYTDHLMLLQGDDAIDLYNFGPAHTSGDTLVVFRKAGVMAAGDVFPGKSQPLIDTSNGGSGVNYGEFIARTAGTIKNVSIVIPGHSPRLTWQDFVDFGEFNRLMLAHAQASRQAGKSSTEALQSFQLPAKFAGYTLGSTMLQQHSAGNFETMYQQLAATTAPAAAAQSPRGRGADGGVSDGSGAIFGPAFNAGQIFQQRCATCHTAEGMTIGDRQALSAAALRELSTERVYQSIATGLMAVQATGIVDRDKRALATFITGKPFAGAADMGVAAMTNACSSNPPLGSMGSSWLGWSATATNARFQPAKVAKLKAQDVAKLKLKWAFGIPGGSIMSGQPSIAFGRVFVASDNNTVYSLDARTGCVYWAYNAGVSGRFAPVIGKISGHPGITHALFFAAGPGIVHAVNPHDGKQIWKTTLSNKVTDASGATRELNSVNASVAYHDGRVYVPFAGSETFYTPQSECCRSRGGLASVDANTGKLLWRVDTIPEPARKIGTAASGIPVWTEAGASVWNTPTIDAKRRLVYVGTGNSYGPIAAATSDSIIAFNMKDGSIAWHHQEFKGDSFMASFGPGGCGQANAPGGACPEKMGPDWDFGGSSAILQRLPNGKDVLLAAGKGGVALALDPDRKGKVVWRTALFDKEPPSALGLVMWGGSSDGRRVYYALQQPGGGLKALDLNTGKVEWSADIQADPRGQSGAVSSIPGVVFTGGWDGVLRAVSSEGKVVWTFDTATDFATVNGVSGKGGSLGVASAAVIDGTVYIPSGYVGIRHGSSGNVLLAFGPE